VDEGTFQEMVRRNELAKGAMDSAEASGRLSQARTDLRTARAILKATSPRNPKGASSLAWEATLGILLGWLSLFGYRITSDRGHHSIAVKAVRALLDSREDTALLQRLDGLRRLRDNAMYNNLPVDAEAVQVFLPDIARLGDRLQSALDHLAGAPTEV
jgi:type VI protein secretion system component VasA